MKPAAADSFLFRDYVGRYEWRKGDVIDTVTEKYGKLWSRFGDDSTDLDEFFQTNIFRLVMRGFLSGKEISGRLHFYATRTRQVIGYTLS